MTFTSLIIRWRKLLGLFYDLVNFLLELQGPSNVIVCQIIHRLPSTVPTRYPVDVDWFNERVNILKQMLSTNLPYYLPGKAFLWRLKGVCQLTARQGILPQMVATFPVKASTACYPTSGLQQLHLSGNLLNDK